MNTGAAQTSDTVPRAALLCSSFFCLATCQSDSRFLDEQILLVQSGDIPPGKVMNKYPLLSGSLSVSFNRAPRRRLWNKSSLSELIPIFSGGHDLFESDFAISPQTFWIFFTSLYSLLRPHFSPVFISKASFWINSACQGKLQGDIMDWFCYSPFSSLFGVDIEFGFTLRTSILNSSGSILILSSSLMSHVINFPAPYRASNKQPHSLSMGF